MSQWPLRVPRIGHALCVAAWLALPALVWADVAASPRFEAVRASFVSSEATLLDRHGVPISTMRIDAARRALSWVALDRVSPAVAAALVAGEDRRFFEHRGVDWSGIASAAIDDVLRLSNGRAARGGSTLTMQLAALLDPSLGIGGRRSLAQKWDQAAAALALEHDWSKRQIIEAYLNLSTFRGEVVGIDAAAQALFGKEPAGLDGDEAAILVALLRAPAATSDAVARRACAILQDIDTHADCERARQLAGSRLAGRYRMAAATGIAPHVAAKLLRTAGARVTSTIDASVQRAAIDALNEHLSGLAGRGVADGAVVVLDNATGDVLAYVGNAGAQSSARDVDGASALRQPGSALKPFLYALAIDRQLLTAASLVDDSPIAIATERGMYVPQDYDPTYRGRVSVRTALASSLNVPAVRTLALAGNDAVLDTLRGFGLDSLKENADYYGAALALGSGEVTLVALANAYRALANGGEFSQIRLVLPRPESAGTSTTSAPAPALAPAHRAIGAGAAFIVADILADRAARAPSFGLDNALATRVWSAAKTGTSKDMRDNWCVGFTDRYTVGVWVGNFDGAPMHDVSGVSGAAPVWRDVIHHLHRAAASQPPARPPVVVARDIAFDPPVEAPRREYFLRGTEMTIVQGASTSAGIAPTIRYPVNDMIVALDPDIPVGHQRIAFEATTRAGDLLWRLDAAPIDAQHGVASWIPVAGRHVLALEDPSGHVLSRVMFEVRGDAK